MRNMMRSQPALRYPMATVIPHLWSLEMPCFHLNSKCVGCLVPFFCSIHVLIEKITPSIHLKENPSIHLRWLVIYIYILHFIHTSHWWIKAFVQSRILHRWDYIYYIWIYIYIMYIHVYPIYYGYMMYIPYIMDCILLYFGYILWYILWHILPYIEILWIYEWCICPKPSGYLT